MTITITIRTDNAAFEDNPETEVGRILRNYAATIQTRGLVDGYGLRDGNGNTVGHVEIVAGDCEDEDDTRPEPRDGGLPACPDCHTHHAGRCHY